MQSDLFPDNGNIRPRPFIKWAGGKSKLLNSIQKFYPSNVNKSFERYIEPFLGGGSVFFDLFSNGELKYKEVILSDANKYLMNCYKALKEKTWEEVYYKIVEISKEAKERDWYDIRSEYNQLINADMVGKDFDRVRGAALFIYLNKTCFNGLYRVNQKGFFNVPKGRQKTTPNIDKHNFHQVHVALQNTQIISKDYLELFKDLNGLNSNDFLYIDPPYYKLSKTSNFNMYHKDFFDLKRHEELAKKCWGLKKSGCYLIISNNFVEDIIKFYKNEFNIIYVETKRYINSKIEERRKIIKEVIFVSRDE